MPNWLTLTTGKKARSSITEHIMDEGHECKRDHCFKIIHKARNSRMLKYMEAVAIKKLKPALNIQVEFDYKLKLPWS